jgi:pyruvate dehydrogenase E2 component (dihydrolipoamide acetyltransferase)
MAEAVLMPKSGISVESCVIGTWKKSVGDTVAVGDILFDYETDKAAFECESTAAGVILDIYYHDGDEVEVLKPVCAVGEDASAIKAESGSAGAAAAPVSAGEPASAVAPASVTAAPASAGEPAPAVAQALAQTSAAVQTPAGAVPSGTVSEALTPNSPAPPAPAKSGGISPRAKWLGGRLGLNPEDAVPTGPNGRVIERDIHALSASGGASGAKSTGAASDAQGGAPSDGAAATAQGIADGSADSARELRAESAVVAPAAEAVPTAVPDIAAKAVATPVSAGVTASTADTALSAAPSASAGQQVTQGGFTDKKLSKIRSLIATSMHASLQNTAQLTHQHSFDATEMRAIRKAFKSSGVGRIKGISIGDMILYAVVKTLAEHPHMNAHLIDGALMRTFEEVNLGVAVDTPRGLMVPTVFAANRKSLTEISEEVKRLAAEARAGSINPDLLQGGTFTVSNLGPTGVEAFTPILNPPQVGILGVCGVSTKVKAVGDEIVAYPSIGVSLTYDHRAVDGAPASFFARDLCVKLSNFSALLDV